MKPLKELQDDELIKQYKSSKILTTMLGIIYPLMIITQIYNYFNGEFSMNMILLPICFIGIVVIQFKKFFTLKREIRSRNIH